MIERINLIEREPFKLTYRKVVQIVAAAIVVCALLFGLLMARMTLQNKSVTKIQAQITRLENERQDLLKAAPTKVDTGPYSDVKNQILATPPWAEFITDIGNRLPVGTYLTSLTASAAQKQITPTDTKGGNKDKKADVKEGGIILSGISNGAAEMSLFATGLKESPFISQVSLKSSEKMEKGFNFVIECQIASDFDLRGSKEK